jgi:ribonuclease Z
MRVTLLGTGSPIPDPSRRGPSQIIEAGNDAILIDCGSGVVQNIIAAGVAPQSIRQVLITHHHSDHTVDLAHLLFSGWVMGWWERPPAIFGPPGTEEFVRRLLHAYEIDINFRLAAGEQPLEKLVPEVTDITAGWRSEGDGWRVGAFAVQHEPVEPAFGFRFEAGSRSVVISGDTHECDSIVSNANDTDLLIHEVYWKKGAEQRKQGATGPGLARMEAIDRYHTGSDAVGRVAADANAKALVLSHILFRGGTPDDLLDDVRRDYRGTARVGADLMSFEL